MQYVESIGPRLGEGNVMGKAKVNQIRKRDGSILAFEPGKIEQAIHKALLATKSDRKELAANLARQVVEELEGRFAQGLPGVEEVQDIVEKVLMARGYSAAAKAYILYRQ